MMSQTKAHEELLTAAAKGGNIELWQTVVKEVSDHGKREENQIGHCFPCVSCCISSTTGRVYVDVYWRMAG